MRVAISDGICLTLEFFREFFLQFLCDFFLRHMLQKPFNVLCCVLVVIAVILAVLIHTATAAACDTIRQMGSNAVTLFRNHTLGLCPDGIHLPRIGREGAIARDRCRLHREVRRRLRELAGEVFLNRLLALLQSIIVFIIPATRLARGRNASGTTTATDSFLLLSLLLRLFLLISQSVKAALHHWPEIYQDLAHGLTAGSGIVVVDTLIDQRNVLVEFVNELTGVAGQVIDLVCPDILDQEVEYDTVVIILAIDHLTDLRHGIREAQVIECDPFGGGARKLIGVPGIHISVFQDVLQRVRHTHDDLIRNRVGLIENCFEDVACMELLHTVQTVRHLRVEFALLQFAEVAVPNAVIGEQVVSTLMRIEALQTHGAQQSGR